MTNSFTMVIFGSTGDLSTRKLLPSLYNLFQAKLITKFSILSLGRATMTDKEYHAFAKKAVKKFAPCTVKIKTWNAFARNLFYKSFDVLQLENYASLCPQISDFFKRNHSNNLIYYLAIHPGLVPKVVNNLGKNQLCRHQSEAKIIIEKPFGQDKKSAAKLNRKILKEFDEKQIYRIDHYLGKETVQNIIFFRFSNSIFEPLWNCNYIDHVQITVAENLGIGTRGAFYEEAGVIRDMVQNHIMQLISLIAMEPPTDFTADLIRDEKVKVLNAIKPSKHEICLGQYASYRNEKNVAPDSNTPTFFAGKFHINNKRWDGVPFYIRTGKKLAEKATTITIEFKQPPSELFADVCSTMMQPNTLNFSIQPQEEIALGFSVKKPGAANKPYPVNMVFNYAKTFKIKPHEAYERLLVDCMKADQTLFARQDGVEVTWQIVDSIIKTKQTVAVYPDLSCGPEEATQLIERDKRKWHKL